MNTIPVTISDNFLNNPNDIRNWALSLKYTSPEDGKYPGERTECLSNIDNEYYRYINRSILSLFFPSNTPTGWSATTRFQKIHNLEKEGWIHQDESVQITAIIYLSMDDPQVNRGTSLYNLKKGIIHPINSPSVRELYNKELPKHYKTGKIEENVYKKRTEWEKRTFTKVLDINDKYNRLIAFDPVIFHANNIVNTSKLNERLTLISFFYGIQNPNNFPIPRYKQTPMM